MKIQNQSGLGDLLFALPLIYDLTRREDVEISTNHSYALEPAQQWGKISCHNVAIGKGGFPIINEGFTHLRYDRYGAHFFERYYNPYGITPLAESIKYVRETYRRHRTSIILGDYAVFAPPRAARRHINGKKEDIFSCTPSPLESIKIINSYNLPIVIIGKDELYHPDLCMPPYAIDLRDTLDFDGLCDIISGSSCVVSQVSAITAMAGLYEIPTHFLKAEHESEEKYEKHINGVIWPGQEILK